jgi:ABC-type transport system involved in multi-copper enzyme maturation permease subunit
VNAIVLIAANFVRQHRWPVVLLFGWIVLTALAVGGSSRTHPIADDVTFQAQQLAIYICIFSAFLAADAIHSERKSRRILLLLSKAISRAEYLFAILFATWTLAFAYALLSALCSVWLTARAILPSGPVWSLMMMVVAGALISSAVAVFFTTFLNPYLATASTLLLFCLPAGFHGYRHAWAAWWPGFPLIVQFLRFGFRSEWAPNWTALVIALVESFVFWAMAAAIFGRRDIAVPIE